MVTRCKNKKCNLPFTRLTKNQKYCPKCRANGEAYYTQKDKEEKECKTCGNIFLTNKALKVYCCKACREAADKRYKKLHIKICEWCGVQFETTDSRKKYHSKDCYIKAKANRSTK